jgi:hypothetical protein
MRVLGAALLVLVVCWLVLVWRALRGDQSTLKGRGRG